MTQDDRQGAPEHEEGGRPSDLTCEEAGRVVFEYLDGELSPELTERVRQHIEICKRCYPYFDFEQAFLDYIQERGSRPRRSEELARRLRALLEEEAASER